MHKPTPVDPLVEQIDEVIDGNGQITQRTKDVLMFGVVKSLLISMNDLQASMAELKAQMAIDDEKIKVLQNRNIVTWIVNHPAPSTFIISLLILLLLSHYGTFVLNFLGIKIP